MSYSISNCNRSKDPAEFQTQDLDTQLTKRLEKIFFEERPLTQLKRLITHPA